MRVRRWPSHQQTTLRPSLRSTIRVWQRVRAQFADEGLVEYPLLADAPPARMNADDPVASW